MNFSPEIPEQKSGPFGMIPSTRKSLLGPYPPAKPIVFQTSPQRKDRLFVNVQIFWTPGIGNAGQFFDDLGSQVCK